MVKTLMPLFTFTVIILALLLIVRGGVSDYLNLLGLVTSISLSYLLLRTSQDKKLVLVLLVVIALLVGLFFGFANLYPDHMILGLVVYPAFGVASVFAGATLYKSEKKGKENEKRKV